jgi:ribonuclease HI
MELTACIEGLRWVRNNAPWHGVTCVLVVTDSEYVQRFIGLAPVWKRSGWRNRDGQPIANHDLWDDLLKARAKAGIRVEFVWQPGKKSEIAKRVDKISKAAAQRGGLNVDRNYKPGAFGRSRVKGGVAKPYPASGQTEVIYPYAKKVMFQGENRVSFNIFDEPTQGFRDKFYAFTTAVIAAEVHRNHLHRVRFNSGPGYPQILEAVEELPVPKATRKRIQP